MLAGRILGLLLGLFYAANAFQMLADPVAWYAGIPGIEHTGPLNTHFVRDIGFAYGCSALATAWGGWRLEAHWALAGASWPALHAGFHLVEWAEHGLPEGAALAGEALGVVLPALLGLALAAFLYRRHQPV